MAEIAAILNETAPNRPYLVAYQLTTTDANNTKTGLAPLKVVPTDDTAHPYLGVFHNQINTTQFATYLGYSSNLSAWHTIGQMHSPASQPDMRILPDDSVLYAEEYNPSGRPSVRSPVLWQCRYHRPSVIDSEPGCRTHHGNDDAGNADGQGRWDSRIRSDRL